MQEYRYDPEMMAHLYEEISCQLLDSPDERITWLENLSSFHANKGNLEESAQTKVITAALIQEYLTLTHRWHTVRPSFRSLVRASCHLSLSCPSSLLCPIVPLSLCPFIPLSLCPFIPSSLSPFVPLSFHPFVP
jgi:hypothetical protein